jgi:hypothetical protein
MRRPVLLFMLLAIATPAWAQNETMLGADFRKEGGSFKSDCTSFSSALSCAELLFTGHPLHIAAGSIAPQNGFGAGGAFIYSQNTDTLRLSYDLDAVTSMNGSWRAGFYMRIISTPPKKEETTCGRPTNPTAAKPPSLLRPVIHLYAQAISLNKLDYFGLGPGTTVAGRSFYGMRQVIPGINVIWPAFRPKSVSLFGEMNGRLVSLRPSSGQPSPSIEQLYTDATAPGLANQPGFLQFGEGIRLRPAPFNGKLRLNYFLVAQQYIAPSDSRFTFARFTADLGHQIPLHSKTRTLLPNDANGPDTCTGEHDDVSRMSDEEKKKLSDHPCPRVTRNLEGSLNFRFFLSDSVVPAGNVVPFYFQPTLGGSDVNGNAALSSYQDYRFRAPNVMLFRQSFEHTLWNLPLGVAFMADEGKVGLTRGDLGSNPWVHSFSAGLTLRAGGFPQVYLMFAWGGNEGTHTTANVNTSLLGGGGRPSLF